MRHGIFLFVAVAAILAGEGLCDSQADEHAWKRVFYLGGVPGVRVDRSDLDQTLTVTPLSLIVRVQPPADVDARGNQRKAPPRVLFEIPLDSILAVDYQGFRHDRPNAQAWIGIPKHWPKATDHLIVFDYRLQDGSEAEVLLRVDKKYFQEVLDVLRKMLLDRGTTTPAVR